MYSISSDLFAKGSVEKGTCLFAVIFDILLAAPNAPPRHIRVIPVSSTELKVTWDPPLPENQNGVLSGYKVS